MKKTKARIVIIGVMCIGLLSSTALAFNLPKFKTGGDKQTDTKSSQTKSDNVVIQKSSRIGKNVIKFAVGGAVVGATAGALSGKNKDMGKNALKGGLIGAAAGGVAGYIYGTIESKIMRSRDQAVAKYKYTEKQGTFVKIESIVANPDAVAKGKNAAFETVYTVLTPNEKETIRVSMGFGIVLADLDENNDAYTPGKLQEFEIKNGGGTFKVNVPLKDTTKYEPQSYKFIVGIEADGKDKKIYQASSANFNIMPSNAGLRIIQLPCVAELLPKGKVSTD